MMLEIVFFIFANFFNIYVFKFCCYQDIVNWDFVVKKIRAMN